MPLAFNLQNGKVDLVSVDRGGEGAVPVISKVAKSIFQLCEAA